MLTEEIYRGDIVLAETTATGEHIQQGKRPYLILSNNANNKYSDIVVGIPFTTSRTKKNIPTHYTFWWNRHTTTALCEQPTLLVKANIYEIMDIIADKHLKEIENRVLVQLDIKGE